MKIALITGASSGMGMEAAIQIGDRFHGVDEIWAVARREDRLRSLEKQLSVPMRAFTLDLTKEKDLNTLKDHLHKEQPQVVFLVNSAGYGIIGPVGTCSEQDEAGMIRLNCEALTRVTRMVLPYMTSPGRILQFASSAAFLPQPGFAIYAATKAFVLSYSRALREELLPRGIYVTAVCPGPVKTEFFDVAESHEKMAVYKKLTMANPHKVVKKAIRDSIMGKTLSIYGITMQSFFVLTKLLPKSIFYCIMSKMAEKGFDTVE